MKNTNSNINTNNLMEGIRYIRMGVYAEKVYILTEEDFSKFDWIELRGRNRKEAIMYELQKKGIFTMHKDGLRIRHKGSILTVQGLRLFKDGVAGLNPFPSGDGSFFLNKDVESIFDVETEFTVGWWTMEGKLSKAMESYTFGGGAESWGPMTLDEAAGYCDTEGLEEGVVGWFTEIHPMTNKEIRDKERRNWKD